MVIDSTDKFDAKEEQLLEHLKALEIPFAVVINKVDLGAPKGRLILPHGSSIRAALDQSSTVMVDKDEELKLALSILNSPPKFVVTDS